MACDIEIFLIEDLLGIVPYLFKDWKYLNNLVGIYYNTLHLSKTHQQVLE